MLAGVRRAVSEGINKLKGSSVGQAVITGAQFGTMLGGVEGAANFIDPEPNTRNPYIPGAYSLFRKFREVQYRKDTCQNQSLEQEQVLDENENAPQKSMNNPVLDSTLSTRLTAALSAFSLNTAVCTTVAGVTSVMRKPAGAAILTLAGGLACVFNSDNNPSNKPPSGRKLRS